MKSGRLKNLLRLWFEMTEHEQRAILIILALFVLGVLVRWRYVLQSV